MTADVDPYLEQQYNNRAAVPDFVDYLNSWKQRSADFRVQAMAYLNVSYGASPRQCVDIFPAGKNSKAPVHIFIHGGYWQSLDKDSFSYLAQTCNEQGECAVIVNYDLCPDATISDITLQIKQLMLWVLNNVHIYGGDPEQIQVTGHSAGAHLLASLLTTDWSELELDKYPFQRLNALSGLYDLRPLIATSINQALGLNQQAARQNSPLFNALWKFDKSLNLNLLVGELESQEYKQQSTLLAEVWEESLNVQLVEAPQVHHFSILDYFLTSYLVPERKVGRREAFPGA